MNKHLIEATNKQGYVVRHVTQAVSNDFGFTNLVVIEGGQYTISFITNVLHGVNYFKIIAVKDYLNNRLYLSNRYHMKFISLINEINGNTHIKIKEANEIKDSFKKNRYGVVATKSDLDLLKQDLKRANKMKKDFFQN